MAIRVSKDGSIREGSNHNQSDGRGRRGVVGWMVVVVVLLSSYMTLNNVTSTSISRMTTWSSIVSEDSFFLPTTIMARFNVYSSRQSTAAAVGTSDRWLPFSDSDLIPLEDLLNTSDPDSYDCPRGQVKVFDRILPYNITHDKTKRRIPRIIHMTAKNRCVPQFVLRHIQQWHAFPNHSFAFWDDHAVDRLLAMPIVTKLFPNLTKTLSCVTAGATKSDLWRYAALYLYGGMYTDIDSSPRPELIDNLDDVLLPYDMAWSVIEGLGVPAQYFIASERGHPWMYHTMNHAIDNLARIVNVMVNNPAINTGPRALKEGFVDFQKTLNLSTTTKGYEPEGFYVGDYSSSLNYHQIAGFEPTILTTTEEPSSSVPSPLSSILRLSPSPALWTIHIVGNKSNHAQYVNRNGLPPTAKGRYWKASNMTHYHNDQGKYKMKGRISCAEHIAKQEKLWNGTYYQKANYAFIDGVGYRDLNDVTISTERSR